MTATYNPLLVIVSALIAVLASYTALDLGGRVTASQGTEQKVWLVGGAIGMGTGIWSMHFLAMLAFSLPIPISYNFWIVIVSLIAAILASGQALFIVSSPSVSFTALLSGAICMGVGIGAMHYIGMAAMEMTATLSYDPVLFLLSVMLAVVASLVALKLSLRLRYRNKIVSKTPQIISALIMGSAILLLHYTGMAAAIFKANYGIYIEHFGFNNSSLAFIVATFTFIILGATLVIASDETEEKRFSR